jgi:hypothetical protein
LSGISIPGGTFVLIFILGDAALQGIAMLTIIKATRAVFIIHIFLILMAPFSFDQLL